MKSHSKQEGAVLVISLLLLLVITLVGLSNLSNTALQENMAGNMQAKHMVFQGADSGIEEAVDDVDFLWEVCKEGAPPATPTNKTIDDTDFTTHKVNGKYNQVTIPMGEMASSIRQGAQAFQLYHFELDGIAELAASHARAEHIQGVYLKGPSGADCSVYAASDTKSKTNTNGTSLGD